MNSARLSPAISAALPWETIPSSYHFTEAAVRICREKSSGVVRSAEKAPSGRSIATWTLISTLLELSLIEFKREVQPCDQLELILLGSTSDNVVHSHHGLRATNRGTPISQVEAQATR